jgi:hypothetical protein
LTVDDDVFRAVKRTVRASLVALSIWTVVVRLAVLSAVAAYASTATTVGTAIPMVRHVTQS